MGLDATRNSNMSMSQQSFSSLILVIFMKELRLNLDRCNNDQLEPLGQSEPIDQPEPSSQSEPSGATPSGFTVEAVNPEAPFHLKELQGCNNRIVLGLDRPCTFCPTFINVCPPGDKTVFLDGYNLVRRQW